MHKGLFKDRINAYKNIVAKICKKWNENNKRECPIKAVNQKLLKTEDEIKTMFKETMSKKFICPISEKDYIFIKKKN